ncbi:MAG: hypothetical protein RLZ53_477 [Actinomycetota bacterium]|jgi:phytoene/squalene synthetase
MVDTKPQELTGLSLYTRAAEASANAVIEAYSTSFGMAVKLLSTEYRQHVANIYGLVRVADEIVDGSAEEAKNAGGNVDSAKILDDLERETYAAIAAGYSSNLIVHAFARTANYSGIDRELIAPFFESMRMDLWKTKHDQKSFEKYVYGSAEVIGLMCLKVFLVGERRTLNENQILIDGARALGAAFQKVNFLRDLGADRDGLGRSYFPGLDPKQLTDDKRDELVADIKNDIDKAIKTLKLLPTGARRAVATALMLFQALNDIIARTPAKTLMRTRIRVPDSYKLVLAIRAIFGWIPR